MFREGGSWGCVWRRGEAGLGSTRATGDSAIPERGGNRGVEGVGGVCSM